jgi:hypothetical protein
MSYAWEKFHEAIRSLVGPGSQRERLVNAMVYHIIYVTPDEVPSEIKDEFRQFREGFALVEAKGGEGNIKATIDEMDDAEVNKMILHIINMHYIIYMNEVT